jgi:hypothetical protein
MITVLYRKRSNEVLKISTKGQSFTDVNAALFGVLVDPDLPDGPDNIDVNADHPETRVLGFQKIADPDLNLVRNATQEEIDSFENAETIDHDIMDKVFAKVFMNDHPRFKKLMKAVVKVLTEEINAVRREVRLEPDLDDADVRKRIKDRIKSDFETEDF